ncbi:Long chronological lifespan protein 2 [Ptychographa xylographoides]|nr:Long chronological lifespan protein 2 [Ptychographa xylographoides]
MPRLTTSTATSTSLLLSLLAILTILLPFTSAQFQFFEQMFQGHPQQQQQQQQQSQQAPQNVASDSKWYQQNYEAGTPALFSSPPTFALHLVPMPLEFFSPPPLTIPHHPPQTNERSRYQIPNKTAHCTNYLCPSTLACVHFPHHCPCAFPATEDKVEFGEGSAVCVSKGGWAPGEAARKIELARKGLI